MEGDVGQSLGQFQDGIRYYDIHVYFNERDEADIESVNTLRTDLQKKFPFLRIFSLVPYPVGPHPIGMFEAHLYNPVQFALVVPWLCLNHRHHSVLIHPNTQISLRDHRDFPLWLGKQLDLDLSIFNKHSMK
eukprot:TRINITY_DN11173_c0_g1_i1.p1 TRINITY_DN11173_c0_g1~~TRINITY_DN11173_c0_g1_i1.p1  ORF type:complete len:132 (-),score=19.04 TRINITY_DN11173_c0_g1_i1:41-436(-)